MSVKVHFSTFPTFDALFVKLQQQTADVSTWLNYGFQEGPWQGEALRLALNLFCFFLALDWAIAQLYKQRETVVCVFVQVYTRICLYGVPQDTQIRSNWIDWPYVC